MGHVKNGSSSPSAGQRHERKGGVTALSEKKLKRHNNQMQSMSFVWILIWVNQS